MRLTPHIFGWSLWWNGWWRASWGRAASYSFGLGPFSLEKEYVG